MHDKLTIYKTILLHMEGALSRNDVEGVKVWCGIEPGAAEREMLRTVLGCKVEEVSVKKKEYEAAFRAFTERNNNGTKIKRIVEAVRFVEDEMGTAFTEHAFKEKHHDRFVAKLTEFWEAIDNDCKE